MLNAAEVRTGRDFHRDAANLIKDLERIELTEGKPSLDEQAIEMAIRFELKKPNGKLTTADLKQLTTLDLQKSQITDVGVLTELKQLTELFIGDNPNLSKAQIDKLQQALPECKISHEFWE